MFHDERVLFIGDGSGWSFLAATQLRRLCGQVDAIFWDHGTPRPKDHLNWKGDWIFTFKADLVLPETVLSKARKGAINFHPAPPSYRGIGGYYFALADGCKTFGATCHHMDDKIDHGDIIAVDHFAVFEDETPASLTDRTAHVCLGLFYRMINQIDRTGQIVPEDRETWGDHLYTRKQLSKLHKEQRAAKQLSLA
ncbi:hypothetical protein So717_36040 [Roseobacter cerasinus]|uniref:phosphoribosylglycinamide formyltransferase 1 n=1 Tax=Roseobacter cerasinus TaxID=2602289 RepID=A0A640VXM3_9RHOB|nr:formyltransferase family protein [Roseobacter cerasinus]GFE51851.1 hypothetical protein So717_36040 [Roseobacter cerasinus]